MKRNFRLQSQSDAQASTILQLQARRAYKSIVWRSRKLGESGAVLSGCAGWIQLHAR
jgi:hypothetical protein